jgi:formate-dependent nitrite reductase membrane component NrfD
MTEPARSYHGQPVIKEPIWTWEIPSYFFSGGLGGASAMLAYLSRLRGNQVLERRAWAAALGGVAVSPALLISDLGRPERFLNMLRMFKITSPMSVGSWLLSASGLTTSIAAAHAWTGAFPRAARLARPAAAVLGLPLSTYTAALIGNTAVPVWHEAHGVLPFMFGSGAALSAGASTLAITPPAHAAAARRVAFAGVAAELAAKQLMERRLGDLAEPYKRGPASTVSHLSEGCVLAGATMLALRGRSRAGAVIASGLMLAGALAARWSVFKAGSISASDPKYVIAPQRSAIEGGERVGAARKRADV